MWITSRQQFHYLERSLASCESLSFDCIQLNPFVSLPAGGVFISILMLRFYYDFFCCWRKWVRDTLRMLTNEWSIVLNTAFRKLSIQGLERFEKAWSVACERVIKQRRRKNQLNMNTICIYFVCISLIDSRVKRGMRCTPKSWKQGIRATFATGLIFFLLKLQRRC